MRRDYAALHERMLADRNRAWVPRIEAMLRAPGTRSSWSVAPIAGGASIQAFLAKAGLHAVRLP